MEASPINTTWQLNARQSWGVSTADRITQGDQVVIPQLIERTVLWSGTGWRTERVSVQGMVARKNGEPSVREAISTYLNGIGLPEWLATFLANHPMPSAAELVGSAK